MDNGILQGQIKTVGVYAKINYEKIDLETNRIQNEYEMRCSNRRTTAHSQ